MSSNDEIEHFAGGTMFAGRDAVELFRLITLKHGIQCESAGIKVKKGPTCRSIARKDYGIRGNAQAQIAQVEELIKRKRADVPVRS